MKKGRCILCGIDESHTSKDNHHVIPRRWGNDNICIYVCRFCHMMMHRAEVLGYCRLPKSIDEYRTWKEEMKEISTNGTDTSNVQEASK